jgi:hypothetical protein
MVQSMCDEMVQKKTARDGTGKVWQTREGKCDTSRAARLYNRLLVEIRKRNTYSGQLTRGCGGVLVAGWKSHSWC